MRRGATMRAWLALVMLGGTALPSLSALGAPCHPIYTQPTARARSGLEGLMAAGTAARICTRRHGVAGWPKRSAGGGEEGSPRLGAP